MMIVVRNRWATQLIAVTLSFVSASGALAGDSSDHDFLDIELSCPSAQGGTLEVIRANKLGQRDRFTITYHGALATKMEVATAKRGHEFETYFVSERPETETDPEMKEFADTLLAKIGILRRGVCLAPDDERERYFWMIGRQKRYLDAP